jgi:putative Mg2+ transporter-C (MgtC) family protein
LNDFFNAFKSNGISGHEIIKLFLSVFAGSIMGIEREVRGKSAGFRTLALICFGATLFTIISYKLGVAPNLDRLAANIITGVGFIGAGVIWRNNSSVSGITTAASIWISAALGMMIGIGEYAISGIALVLALVILYTLDFVQFWIDDNFQHRRYTVTFRKTANTHPFYHQFKALQLKIESKKIKVLRKDEQIVLEFSIYGKESNLDKFNDWLVENGLVLAFEW